MKNWIQSAWATVMMLSGCFALAILTGCESLQNTSFAPLDAKLEPTHSGGAQYLVVINTSGQTLHNFRFTGDIQNDNTITYMGNDPASYLPNRLPATTYIFRGSGAKLEPGQEVRFKTNFGMGAEGSILYPVSRVQIAGICDEGRFRESWQIIGAGQPQPIGRSPHRD